MEKEIRFSLNKRARTTQVAVEKTIPAVNYNPIKWREPVLKAFPVYRGDHQLMLAHEKAKKIS